MGRSRGCWTRLGSVRVHGEKLLTAVGACQTAAEPTFWRVLETSGKRLTRQRQLIVEQVFSHHDHFDADELIEHLQPLIARRKVSRPTVYRTLVELVEAGMLRKMDLGGRASMNMNTAIPATTILYCQNCNRLIEFHSAELERIRDTGRPAATLRGGQPPDVHHGRVRRVPGEKEGLGIGD